MEGECFYHLCKKKGPVTDCPHCKQQFCEQHKKPAAPHGPMRTADTAADRMARLEENRSHPCAPYVTWKAEQDKAAAAKYKEYLDGLKEQKYAHSTNKSEPKYVHVPYIKDDTYDEDWSESESQPIHVEKPISRKSLIILFTILALIVIITFAYFFYQQSLYSTPPVVELQRNSSGFFS